MKAATTHPLRALLLAQAAYLLSWLVAQLWVRSADAQGTRQWQLALFTVGYVALPGVLPALLALRRAGMPLHDRRVGPRRRALGILIALVGVGVGVIGSGALAAVIEHPPAAGDVVTYTFLFVPMALAISLQSLLIPAVLAA